MSAFKRIAQCHIFMVLFFAANAASVPDPVVFYPLNSKYETREINNRLPQGTPVGVSLAAGPDGKLGGSYQFTGRVNSYIEFPNNGKLEVKHSITLLCWIYPENTAGPIFNYGKQADEQLGVIFWIGYGGKLFALFPRRNQHSEEHLISEQKLAFDQWHYVGVSYDYNTGMARLWLNGQPITEKNIGAGVTLVTHDDVRMGVIDDNVQHFKGRITSMQVYDIALTAEQINAVNNFTVSQVDVCEEEKPCKNGGECRMLGDSYTCNCTEGYQGRTCDSSVANLPDSIVFYPLNSKYETREINNRLPQGTPVGVSLAAGPDGKPGGSYQFTGTVNSYIYFPNNGRLEVKHSITLLCWIYPENTTGPIFNYAKQVDGQFGVGLWMVEGGKLYVLLPSRNYYYPKHLISEQKLAFDQWHYVGVSYDYNTGMARLWLNGQPITEKNIGAGVRLTTYNDVRMGVIDDGDKCFKGRITSMQVYDIALTAEQINAVNNFTVSQDIDECSANSVVCYNGGNCVDGINEYTCDCQPGYIGQHCEWEKQGCWKEVKNKQKKALVEVYDQFKKYKKDVQSAVEACLKSAEEKQLQIFGVRNMFKCVTAKKGSTDFTVYGASKNCKEQKDYGVGGKTTNYVYVLKKSK